MYNSFAIVWKTQLQTEIVLSSTESEYMGISYALRDAIPLMLLIKEMHVHGFPIKTSTATVKCQVFEDNTGAIEITRIKKYHPRTEHLNCRMHHFGQYVDIKQIVIEKIGTADQPL